MCNRLIFCFVTFLTVVASKPDRCAQNAVVHSSLKGSISSPGYPYAYRKRQLCIHHIDVPQGFKIKVEFIFFRLGNRQNNDCLKNDNLVLSTKMLHFQDLRSLSKKYQLVICGNKKPSKPILTQGNQLWTRFYADDKRSREEQGFNLVYSAIDKNECNQRRSPCEHICVNTVGSFYCKCNQGYKLKNDKKQCEVHLVVHFTQNQFNITIPANDVYVGQEIIDLSQNVRGNMSKRDLTYTITEQETARLFEINKRTGMIFLRKLPEKRSFNLVVQASLSDGTSNNCVVTIVLEMDEIPVKRFTILLQQSLAVNDEIFDLRRHFAKPHASLIFFAENQKYFGVKSDGKVFIKDPLPAPFNGTVMQKTSFKVNIQIVDELGFDTESIAFLQVVFLPLFPGENLLTPDILQQVSNELNNEDILGSDESKFKTMEGKFKVVGLHRLFRRASEKSRKISKAKLYFDEVLKRVQKKVEETYSHDTRKGDPIIVHLGTGQIVSSQNIEKVIDASKCKDTLNTPDCSAYLFGANYRPFDGACNNIINPLWGAASTAFKRLLPPQYYDADALSDPIGFPNLPEAPTMPSAHTVSQTFFKVHKARWDSNNMPYSHMLMQWGQFLDHDITMTAESEGGHHCVFPRCDNSADDFILPCFPMMYPGHNEGCSMFIRSSAVCQTGNAKIEPRQQMNTITSFIDASMIYGSSEEKCAELRVNDGSGLLKTSRSQYLPILESDPSPPLSFCKDFGGCFDAGDVRANEQVALTSMHTLWVREHNRIARHLRIINKKWSGERTFLEARKIVAGQIQHITYNEFLPKILGKVSLPVYSGYQANVDPSVSNVFATAAFRFGHSLVQPAFSRIGANFNKVAEDLPLVRAFFNNTLLLQEGIEPFLFGMIANTTSGVDRNIAHGLARGLFQRPGAVRGFDLAALNIQRGRDHGLPGYGRWREFCKLSQAYDFEDLKSVIKNNETRKLLQDLYDGRVEFADVFVAGLAEDHVEGALIGPLFHCLIKEQFIRLRDGDRYFYENDIVFTKDQLHEIKRSSLASVMCHNMQGIVSIQTDVFKTFDPKNERRKVCNDIQSINLDFWKEDIFEEKREWSAWHETIRLPTGTWISNRSFCGNLTVLNIECKSMENKMYTEMNENVHCIIPIGIFCRNKHLSDTTCSDYKVRMLCSNKLSVDNHVDPRVGTGHPKYPKPAPFVCKGVDDNDYAMGFPTLDETVIEDPYHVSTKSEYLNIGKTGHYKKRILLKFDLRRIRKTDAVHSATLQLFYVGHSRSTFSQKILGSSHLEAYLITSTGWNGTNVTSRVPWMEDYLSVGKDTDPKRLGKVEITHDHPGWLQLNLYRAVRQWRVSRGSLHRENFGIMLMVKNDDDESSGMSRIASSIHDNVTIRPRLLVCLSSSSW